jgi:hypothetical protein
VDNSSARAIMTLTTKDLYCVSHGATLSCWSWAPSVVKAPRESNPVPFGMKSHRYTKYTKWLYSVTLIIRPVIYCVGLSFCFAVERWDCFFIVN